MNVHSFRLSFSLRSLLVLVSVAAVLTVPTYRYAIDLYERGNTSKPVTIHLPTLSTKTLGLQVPTGATVVLDEINLRPDGSKLNENKVTQQLLEPLLKELPAKEAVQE